MSAHSSDRPVVVVTGASKGLGRGLCLALAHKGARVLATARNQSMLDSLVSQAPISEEGSPGIVSAVCDVTDPVQVEGLWNRAVELFGRVDHWVNNAGLSLSHPNPVAPLNERQQIFDVNLMGAWNGLNVAVAGFSAQQAKGLGGGTVYTMEGLGSRGEYQERLSAYGASKYSLAYVTKAFVKSFKGSGVRVCSLSPGMVITDLLLDGQPIDQLAPRTKRIYNVLADRVETVADFLSAKILAHPRHGAKVRWLTGTKALGRFLTAPFRRRKLFENLPPDDAPLGTGSKPRNPEEPKGQRDIEKGTEKTETPQKDEDTKE